MGEDAATTSAASDSEMPVGESRSAPSAPSKQVIAARKKMVKSLKSKDAARKVEAAKFCLQDELFLQEPDVAALLLGFLGKVKTPELVRATLAVFKQLLTATPSHAAHPSADGASESTTEPVELHPEINARFLIEQSCLPESPWKGCEPFLAVLTVSSFPPDVKILAVQVYRALLTASVKHTMRDRSRMTELSIVQTFGSPRTTLLATLDAEDKELQLVALACLATLFQKLVDNNFLSSADEQPAATARFLAFASHSDRRFHDPVLSIVDSVSRYAHGRAFLRASQASEVLSRMLVDVGSTPGSVLSLEETAVVGANTAVACRCLCRLEFAKEQPIASADEVALNEPVIFPAIDAMVALLQHDVCAALLTAPGANASAPVQTPVAAPAAPAAAVMATAPVAPPPAPFPSDKCVAVIMSLGRMVQASDRCKARANEQGVLPVLLDCFKLPDELGLHQVADKLLHLCILLPGADDSFQLNVNPRVLSSAAQPPPDTSDASPTEQLQPPFLLAESVLALLELPPTPGDTRLLFRAARWLAVLVEAPANALALGDANVEPFLRVLAQTSPQHDLLFGFLARCVTAIVSQSGGACEQCALEALDPTGAFVVFLQSAGSPSEATQSAAQLVGRGAELCKLEWLDEERAEAIFEPMPLTSQRHDFDPFLSVADALHALVRGYAKWNPPAGDGGGAASPATDFFELLLQKLDTGGGAGGAAGAPGSKSGVAMPSKKKIELSKPTAVGEGVACSILAKSVELAQLISFFSEHLSAVSSGLLRLLAELLRLPGGVRAMVQLAKQAKSPGAERDGDLASSSSIAAFAEWPLAEDQTERTEFAHLIRPLLVVLQSPDATFAEVEAAVDVLDLLTGSSGADTVVYSAVLPTSGMSVEVPIAQSCVFANALANAGVLVLLLAYMDDCRMPDFAADAARRTAFVAKTRTLVMRFVVLGSELLDVALAKIDALESAAIDAADAALEPSRPKATAPRIEFVTRWAKDVLDRRVDVPRFEYAGYPALLLAAELGDNAVALALLSAGASPDTTAIDGTSALMLALLTGNEELALALLQRRADVDAMTIDGCDLSAWTCALASPRGQPLHVTITRSHEATCGAQNMALLVELDSLRGSPVLLEPLLAAGVDARVSDADGNFLLHALVAKLHVRRKLRGLDVCVRYHSRRHADARFLLDTVDALVERHAVDVDACNRLGQTALHLALIFGHADVVQRLLQLGANPNVQDAYGYLPLHYACLALCDSADGSGEGAVAVVQELLRVAPRFALTAGEHVDLRKHKLPHEKRALAIDAILDGGFVDATEPKALTTQVATAAQVLVTRGRLDGLLPWHLACGGCNLVAATLCLDDDMRARLASNGAARARVLALMRDAFAVDLSARAAKDMTALHFALKKDVDGGNAAVLDVLLATPSVRAQLNASHDPTTIDLLPPIPEGAQVDVLTANLHAIHCYASARSFDSKYHVILPNGTHLDDLHREQIQQSDGDGGDAAASSTTSSTPFQGTHPKYLHLAESAFSPLHYAVQSSDALALRLLALEGISTSPEGSDVPLLALACVARRSPQVVAQLLNPQANMRVHLPLLGAPRDVIANQIATCSLASRKHAAALHYAVLYEDVAVVRALVASGEFTNVNVRRSGDGFTPLHLACEMCHLALVQLLLDHGANLLQQSTMSAAASGVTPLQLLMKNDSSENETLKALIAGGYLGPEMLLERFGGSPARAASSVGLLDAAAGGDDAAVAAAMLQDESDGGHSCLLLTVEELNAELFARVSQLRESRREAQALSRRVIKDLEKSDDALDVFFKLFQPDTSAAAAAFDALAHPHECYRRRIVRSRWMAPRPPAIARHASNSSAAVAVAQTSEDPTVGSSSSAADAGSS